MKFNKLSIILILLGLLTATSVSAQKSKSKTKAKAKAKKEVVVEEEPEVEPTPEEKLYNELLLSTAKVMFFDSLVVDRNTFMDHIPFPKEMGKISYEGEDVSYTNEFQDTRITAKGNIENGRHLYISHRYGNKWEDTRKLDEIDSHTPWHNAPFLMADGITLYYSALGENTVGGTDIFRTSYDAEDTQFYEATNLGLPFNSPANEYLLAISDYDQIGWLVTDRNQPEGKVCIYYFEPTSHRVTFDGDEGEEQLKSFAIISSIRNTWSFGNRTAALKRKEEMQQRMVRKQVEDPVEFVVNDELIYHSLEEFKSQESKDKYLEIKEKRNTLRQLTGLLEQTRASYATSNSSNRHEISRQIKSLEDEVYLLEEQIKLESKKLRNAENQK